MENHLDERFDQEFAKIQELNWLPWVGKNYINAPKGKKLLIIGESHYVPADEENEFYSRGIWTREFILKEGLNDPNYYTGSPTNKLVGNLEKAIYGYDPSKEEKVRLWQSTAYFNVIQTLLDNINSRPDYDDKLVGRDVFFSVLQILDPDYCLFGGVEIADFVSEVTALNNLGYQTNGLEKMSKISNVYPRRTLLNQDNGNKKKFLFVKHPSRYFSWSKWAEFLSEEMGEYKDWMRRT